MHFIDILLLRYNNQTMSHSQNSSESSQSPKEDNDLKRLESIWRNIKNSKEAGPSQHGPPSLAASHKSVSSVRKAIQHEERKNLQMRLEMTEKQLMKARENTALLMKKLSEAEERNQYLEFQLEKQSRENQQKAVEIQELKARLSNTKSSGTFGKQSKEKERQYIQKQAKELSEMNELKKRLEFKEKQIDRLTLKIKSLQLNNKNMDTDLQAQNQMVASLRSKLTSAQTAMNELYFSEQSKGAQLLQLEEAKKAIERLVFIIKKTDEYGKLGGWMQGEGYQIRFLTNMPKKIKANLNQKRKSCSCTDIKIDERLLWTPSICYKALLNLKIKYSSTLSEECIEQLLYELNKLYISKEETSLLKQRQYYEGELSKLKKKGEQRYDELVARKQIQRLKKEISQTKFGNRKGGAAINNGEQLQTLRKIGQYQDELRLKMKEIKLLQERIKLMQTQTSNYDKVLYLEGALWILDKLLAQLQLSQTSLLAFQTSFRDATTSLPSGELWLPYFKDFFQRMQEENAGLVSKLEGMKDSTLKKMGRIGGRVQDSINE